ncbi:MAG: hypothetical protein MJ252_11295 [archaeon]|nr:hypothetical protein [archaeon]
MSAGNSEAKLRLLRDFKAFENNDNEGIMASPQEDNILKWDCVIFGPENTPWDGGCK